MAQITWTDEARRWLEDIFEYIAADNPEAAAQTVEGIFERAQVLAQYHELGQALLTFGAERSHPLVRALPNCISHQVRWKRRHSWRIPWLARHREVSALNDA
jgi:hypothetical protein